MKRRTVGQEINLLKTFLGDKISSINQMKDELKYKDIDSNTMDGVRNVNELGKCQSVIIVLLVILVLYYSRYIVRTSVLF